MYATSLPLQSVVWGEELRKQLYKVSSQANNQKETFWFKLIHKMPTYRVLFWDMRIGGTMCHSVQI